RERRPGPQDLFDRERDLRGAARLAGPHSSREAGSGVHAGPRAGGYHAPLRCGAGYRSLRRHRRAERRQVVRRRHDEHSRLQGRPRRPSPPRGIHLRRDRAGAQGQAGALPMPPGVDCVTLPALRREADGGYNPRFLADVSDLDVISLRARVIRSAIKTFVPDVLVVDCLPVGVAGELTRTLARLRKGGNTRCVLGLRDVLQDAETVRRDWSERAHMDAIRDYYDAIWVYGDPAVYDPVREYDLPDYAAAKVRYTGYLDQRPRLEFAEAQTAAVLASLPPGRVALCVV